MVVYVVELSGFRPSVLVQVGVMDTPPLTTALESLLAGMMVVLECCGVNTTVSWTS